MSLDFYERHPHLLSPLYLAAATWEWWSSPPHLQLCNDALKAFAFEPGSRLIINMPYGHGKTWLMRVYAAWRLLNWPDKQLMVVSMDQDLAVRAGLAVRDLFDRWGADLGLEIREDTKAKGYWRIQGHEGGMESTGWHGRVLGRHPDEIILDDLLKQDQAMSPVILDAMEHFYRTVVFSRISRKNVSCACVGTRWARRDVFGVIQDQAARTSMKWKVLKFKAIATEDEPHLGRKKGEALWPQQYSLAVHEAARIDNGKWFDAGWQQEPTEDEGSHFKPKDWPEYLDLGGAYSLGVEGGRKVLWAYDDCVRMIVVDWAMSEKKTSDYTAMGVFAVTPDGRMLVLDVVNQRYSIEAAVPALAALCREWKPHLVVVETDGFQAALAAECRRHKDIPEPRGVRSESRSKVARAVPAIVMGENKRIFLPDRSWYESTLIHKRVGNLEQRDWLGTFREQLASFTGIDDKHDDIVDVVAWGAQQVNLIAPVSRMMGESGACLLTAGKADDSGWMGGVAG